MATKTMFLLILNLSLIAGWLCEEMRPRPIQRTLTCPENADLSRGRPGPRGEVPPNGVRSRDGLTCAAGICDLIRIG